MFQTLLGALLAFIGLSLHGAAGRKFYDGHLGEHELKEFVGSCLQILLVSSALTLIVVVSVSGQLAEWMGLEKKWIVLAVLVTACTTVIQIRLGQWQVRKEAKRYGVLQVSHSLLNLALSLALAVALAQGAGGRISAQVWAAGFIGSAVIRHVIYNTNHDWCKCEKTVGGYGRSVTLHIHSVK